MYVCTNSYKAIIFYNLLLEAYRMIMTCTALFVCLLGFVCLFVI